jgi:glucuronoarabinoxylan endo-1,4-beta-xylanase
MKYPQIKIAIVSSLIFLLFFIRHGMAQNVTVTLSSEKQVILGFGGMNCPTWSVNLTADQTTMAFGNGTGQLGMTILRLMVNPNSGSWSSELTVAKKAVSLGATVFASPWNAPSSMLSNRHVKASSYGAYADHLNSFVTYMKDNGVELYAISVQNEPDYGDWTQWSAQEIVTFLKQNASVIQTKVIAPESFQYRKAMSDPILNDAAALANMDILGAHLYGTQLRDFPYPLFKEKGAGKELWMTEVYTESQNDADLWPMALDVATNIHNSMVEAEFNVYTWWYIRRSYGMLKENGQISKRGHCMSQFTKFVRPGAHRVDATKSPTTGVNVSAYKSKNNDSLIIVAVNTTTSSKTVNFTIAGGSAASLAKYTTSGSKSLAQDGSATVSNGSFSGTLDAQSVSTWVGSLTNVGIVNSDAGKTTGPLSIPAKESSNYTVYDLNGRRVSSNRIDALGGWRSALNLGVYIIKNEKSGCSGSIKIIYQ